jgi:hypothetical protein
MKKYLLPVLVLFTFSAYAQVKIDGTFFDWDESMQLDVAPNAVETTFGEGDDTEPVRGSTDPAYFADMDIEDVYATDDADFIYIRVKMNSVANVLNIPVDTSYHGGGAITAYISVDPGEADTTGLTWGWWGNGYDYMVQVFPADSVANANTRFQQFVWEHKQSGNGWDYEVKDSLVGSSVAWNASNNDVEFAIPKKLLFNPKYMPNFVFPENIAIMIYAGENLAPWRADYASEAGIAGFKLPVKAPGTISVDGVFFDWDASTQLDAAPNAEELTFADGDETEPVRGISDASYFADLDIEDVFGTSDDDFVYLRVKMNSAANVLNVASDTSYHGGGAITAYISVDPGTADTTGLTWGWWGNGYDYFIQAYPADSAFEAMTGYPQPVWEHKQAGNGWDYEVADTIRGAWVAWNAVNNDVELAIPKSLLLSPRYLPDYQQQDSIAVMIFAGENLAPWRADYASMPGVAGFILNINNITSVNDNDGKDTRPSKYALAQNYPNPFNPSTTINYTLPESGNVKVRVFNILGQEVAAVVNSFQAQGNYSVRFDAGDLSAGVYFYSLEVNNYKEFRKMIFLK